MDAKSFINQFRFSGPGGFATDGDIEEIQSFLAGNADTARLWNFCGDAIQMSNSVPSRFSLDDSRKCYETAIAKFPDDFEGYESLGCWHDVHGKLEQAESYFRLACERKYTETSCLGLARVLAQLGRKTEGLALLAECSDQDSLDLKILREEIEDGDWSPEG